MNILTVTVTGAQLQVQTSGVLTRGMVGGYGEFQFDQTWENLRKTVVFRAGDQAYGVTDVEEVATIPWEILEKENCTLYVGVYGTNEDGTLVIPTVWGKVGVILPGTDPSADPAGDPTEPLWQQALDLARSVHEQALAGDFDGYTPRRGVDYWTSSDKEEIHSYVEAAILGGAW